MSNKHIDCHVDIVIETLSITIYLVPTDSGRSTRGCRCERAEQNTNKTNATKPEDWKQHRLAKTKPNHKPSEPNDQIHS